MNFEYALFSTLRLKIRICASLPDRCLRIDHFHCFALTIQLHFFHADFFFLLHGSLKGALNSGFLPDQLRVNYRKEDQSVYIHASRERTHKSPYIYLCAKAAKLIPPVADLKSLWLLKAIKYFLYSFCL